jgi:hypothetical protein
MSPTLPAITCSRCLDNAGIAAIAVGSVVAHGGFVNDHCRGTAELATSGEGVVHDACLRHLPAHQMGEDEKQEACRGWHAESVARQVLHLKATHPKETNTKTKKAFHTKPQWCAQRPRVLVACGVLV